MLRSGAVFLAAHAVLVESWRLVLASWDARLPFWTAARIWSVSNLGRYVPGKVWQIGAMGAMARSANVSPIAASGSAILGTLVNVLAGFVIVLVSGRALLERQYAGASGPSQIIVVVALAVLLGAPWIVPRLAPFAARVLRRPVTTTLPVSAVVYSLTGNCIAWLLYGFAFQLFANGMLGRSAGSYSLYLAAYTISYLAGYLAFIVPAGAGVRELSLIALLEFAALATPTEAALLALTSRVWLTILEVTPAVLFWTLAVRRPPTSHPSDAPT